MKKQPFYKRFLTHAGLFVVGLYGVLTVPPMAIEAADNPCKAVGEKMHRDGQMPGEYLFFADLGHRGFTNLPPILDSPACGGLYYLSYTMPKP